MISDKKHDELKKKYGGFYQKFNNQVIENEIRKIFDYNEMFNNARNFETIEKFYNFYLEKNKDTFEDNMKRVYQQRKNQFDSLTEKMVYDCFVIRMGNLYKGTVIETKIINTLQNLTDWIKIEKTDDNIDKFYKVDAIVKLESIDNFGLQIKKNSYKLYDDKGKEKEAHNRFKIEFGMDVYYLYYFDYETISFMGNTVKLDNSERLLEIFEGWVLQLL